MRPREDSDSEAEEKKREEKLRKDSPSLKRRFTQEEKRKIKKPRAPDALRGAGKNSITRGRERTK